MTSYRPDQSERGQVADESADDSRKVTHTMPKDLARQVDDYWHDKRLASRSEAIRRLIVRGLEVESQSSS